MAAIATADQEERVREQIKTAVAAYIPLSATGCDGLRRRPSKFVLGSPRAVRRHR